jgi:potassium-transporting ATPase potassium-binding subunit
MSGAGWIELLFVIALLCISTPILGSYLAKIYENKKAPGDRFFLPIENAIYRVSGIDPEGEQRWTAYVFSMLVFTIVGGLMSYGIFRFQKHLPFNPDHMGAVAPALSFNTTVSFITNTNWQNYVGEATMSHLSQMFGLVWHQFISAAVGMALAAAFIRALVRSRQTTLGSFWVDTIRTTTRVLVPLCLVFAILFMSQGVIQNFHATKSVTTVATQSVDSTGSATAAQKIPGGPVASMTPIEALGDNGGGFFNVNGAHPFESPNPLVAILYVWLMLMIPFAFPWTFGKMIGSMRQGMVVLTAMGVLFMIGMMIVVPVEAKGNNKLTPAGVTQTATASHGGGNLEGKDLRIGVFGSTIAANSLTATSTGMTNSAHESYTPIGGSVPLFQMMLGEVDPGGTGSGLYGMLILVFISVFIAGLMVGRTPEYLGKKIQGREVKLAAIYILVLPFTVLVLASYAILTKSTLHSLWASGPHGLTELLYAYTSTAHNNGSAMAGITGNTQWYNVTLGFTMLIGRFMLIIPALAISGSLVRKRVVPESAGTLRTDTPLFTALLIAVTVIITGLTYFPVMALGPLAEHFAGHF